LFLLWAALIKKWKKQFNFEQLFNTCNWNVESAVEFYLNNISEISAIFPPIRTIVTPTVIQPVIARENNIRISCGHVESDLSVDSIQEVKGMMNFVLEGLVPPASMDGEYGEYTNGKFTIILPTKSVKKLM